MLIYECTFLIMIDNFCFILSKCSLYQSICQQGWEKLHLFEYIPKWLTS